jgi:hypothetical protein
MGDKAITFEEKERQRREKLRQKAIENEEFEREKAWFESIKQEAEKDLKPTLDQMYAGAVRAYIDWRKKNPKADWQTAEEVQNKIIDRVKKAQNYLIETEARKRAARMMPPQTIVVPPPQSTTPAPKASPKKLPVFRDWRDYGSMPKETAATLRPRPYNEAETLPPAWQPPLPLPMDSVTPRSHGEEYVIPIPQSGNPIPPEEREPLEAYLQSTPIQRYANIRGVG